MLYCTNQYIYELIYIYIEHQLAQVDMIDRSLAWAYGNDLLSDDFLEPKTMVNIYIMYVYMCVNTCLCDYVYIYIHINPSLDGKKTVVGIFINIYIVHIFVYIYVYVIINIYIYICIYIRWLGCIVMIFYVMNL
jgi:hypothetical protein